MLRFFGHAAPVTCVCEGSEGDSVFFTGSSDTRILVWDARTAKLPMWTWQGHRDTVVAIRSFGSDMVVSAGQDGSVCEWDVPTGRLTRKHECDAPIITAESTDAGDFVVATWAQNLHLWSYDSTATVRPSSSSAPLSSGLTSSADGRASEPAPLSPPVSGRKPAASLNEVSQSLPQSLVVNSSEVVKKWSPKGVRHAQQTVAKSATGQAVVATIHATTERLAVSALSPEDAILSTPLDVASGTMPIPRARNQKPRSLTQDTVPMCSYSLEPLPPPQQRPERKVNTKIMQSIAEESSKMVTQRTNDLRRNRFENHVACTDLPTTRVNAPVQISATTPSMNDTSMTAGKANVSTLSSAPTHDLGPPVMAAREDTGTGGPKAKEFDLMVFLEGAKLLAHTEALKVGGYEEVPDLDEADDSDLMELGFKKPEVKRLRRYLSKELHRET